MIIPMLHMSQRSYVLPRLDLWGHVQRGPDAAPEVPRSFGLEGAAEAEVHELQRRLLDRAVLEQQEVLRLEVSVGEAVGVHVVHSAEHLLDHDCTRLLAEPLRFHNSFEEL